MRLLRHFQNLRPTRMLKQLIWMALLRLLTQMRPRLLRTLTLQARRQPLHWLRLTLAYGLAARPMPLATM